MYYHKISKNVIKMIKINYIGMAYVLRFMYRPINTLN